MASDAVLNCPVHQNLYVTLQELHDEVHRLRERRRLSDDEFAEKGDELLPRVEEAARAARVLTAPADLPADASLATTGLWYHHASVDEVAFKQVQTGVGEVCEFADEWRSALGVPATGALRRSR